MWHWSADRQLYPLSKSSEDVLEFWQVKKNTNILLANLVKSHKKHPNVCVAQFSSPSFLVWPSGKYFEQHWPLQPPIHHPSSSTAPHRLHVCESSLWWSSLPRPPAAVLYIQTEIRGAAVMYTLLLLLLSDSLRRQSQWGIYKKKILKRILHMSSSKRAPKPQKHFWSDG